jgi:hypothetical protein
MWSRSVAKIPASLRRLYRNLDNPLVSNADLEKILRITKVPARRHGTARRELISAILIADGSAAGITYAHRGPRPRSRSETLCRQGVARRARALYDAIERLLENGEGPHGFFENWAIRKDEEEDFDDFDLFDLQSCLETLAETCDRRLGPRSKKQPHRPRGSLQYPALQFTITKLHEAIETQGRGELSLWRDTAGKWKGTVSQVLAILHPCLPHLVTANPPYATLQRVLSTCRGESDGRNGGQPSQPHRCKKP